MIPILDCGYSKFKWLLKSIKIKSEANSSYKGNLKRKKKREEREKERLRSSFIHQD